jgi:hypothetical protein
MDQLAAACRGTPAALIVQELEQRPQLPLLVPPPETPWRYELSQRLSDIPAEALCGRQPRDVTYADAVKAGLLLWNDDLASAHALAQRLSHPTGSYWHALMHRREPDYGNSKYWFDRVGDHPIYPDLKAGAAAVATALGDSQIATAIESSYEWNPHRFVDWCESAARQPAAAAVLQQIQLEEIRLLLLHSCRRARGMTA